jgi:hypothetical protein
MQNERIIFELSDRAALGADDLQWILYRATGTKRCRTPMDAWKGVSFVRSTKSILLRCVREKALEVSPTGCAYLSALQDTFAEWKLAQPKSLAEVLRGRAVKERVMHLQAGYRMPDSHPAPLAIPPAGYREPRTERPRRPRSCSRARPRR